MPDRKTIIGGNLGQSFNTSDHFVNHGIGSDAGQSIVNRRNPLGLNIGDKVMTRDYTNADIIDYIERAMHNFIDIDIILKPGIVASVEIEFEMSCHGWRGDYHVPGFPNEYEITGLSINNVMCFSGPRRLMWIAEAWYKTGPQLVQGGWHDDLCKIAKPLLDADYYDEWQRLADHEFNTEPSPC